MTRVPCLAVAVDATRAGRVGDAELIGVEEEGIGVGNIELLLFAHEAGALAGDTLHETLAQSTRQLVEFFFGKVDSEIVFAAVSLQAVLVSVLLDNSIVSKK